MLNDTEKEKVTQTQEKEKMDGRRENVHLAKIGLMVFITFVCCILFFSAANYYWSCAGLSIESGYEIPGTAFVQTVKRQSKD